MTRPRRPKRGRAPTTPGYVLDAFTGRDVRQWKARHAAISDVEWDFYTDLLHQRTRFARELRPALLDAAEGPFEFVEPPWHRIIDYEFSLEPLSAVGSVRTSGGRFNVGDIDPVAFPVFAALYLASNEETARAEKLGIPRSDGVRAGLSREVLALRTPPSISIVRVKGRLETIIDLCKPARLDAFVKIIRRFKVSATLLRRARDLGIRQPRVVRSARGLLASMLHPGWRGRPELFDVPATSQLFGRLALDAGVEGIVYPSARSGGTCLAVFPEALGPSSFVQIDDPAPSGARIVMDSSNWKDFV